MLPRAGDDFAAVGSRPDECELWEKKVTRVIRLRTSLLIGLLALGAASLGWSQSRRPIVSSVKQPITAKLDARRAAGETLDRSSLQDLVKALRKKKRRRLQSTFSLLL